MIIVQETTNWDTPNHAYILDDSRSHMHGYSVGGREPLQMFKAPIGFSTRGRTFQFISNYAGETIEYIPQQVVVDISGSKGSIYKVVLKDNGDACSCPGFKYRSECKHIEKARAELYL